MTANTGLQPSSIRKPANSPGRVRTTPELLQDGSKKENKDKRKIKPSSSHLHPVGDMRQGWQILKRIKVKDPNTMLQLLAGAFVRKNSRVNYPYFFQGW
jgi:hypothetical protein